MDLISQGYTSYLELFKWYIIPQSPVTLSFLFSFCYTFYFIYSWVFVTNLYSMKTFPFFSNYIYVLVKIIVNHEYCEKIVIINEELDVILLVIGNSRS